MNLAYNTLYIETEFGTRTIVVFEDGSIKRDGVLLKPADNCAGYLSVLVGYKRNKMVVRSVSESTSIV